MRLAERRDQSGNLLVSMDERDDTGDIVIRLSRLAAERTLYGGGGFYIRRVDHDMTWEITPIHAADMYQK